jgi:hypothetical protein
MIADPQKDRRQEQQQGQWAYGAGRFAEKASDVSRSFDARAMRPWWKWVALALVTVFLLIPWAVGLVRGGWLW